jgi:hypothetical protein
LAFSGGRLDPCVQLPICNRAAIGLFVDAKDQEAKRYYAQFGFAALPSNELELFLPVKTIQEALTPHP